MRLRTFLIVAAGCTLGLTLLVLPIGESSGRGEGHRWPITKSDRSS